MATLESAHSPQYNADGSIDLLATFSGLSEIPYTARLSDEESAAIFTRAAAGEFGTVSEYVAPEPTDFELWQALQREALAALDDTDICVVRCYEHGVAVPAEWVAYRDELRVIVRTYEGDASTGLPTRPPYPEGT